MRYLNQPVKVKFTGGREVKGILKGRGLESEPSASGGHDTVANLVLDEVQVASVSAKSFWLLGVSARPRGSLQGQEVMRCHVHFEVSEETRTLGLVVARGTSVLSSEGTF